MERMLPAFADIEAVPRLPFGARSEAAVYLGQLLVDAAPGMDIVAIARRPGVVSKVAVIGVVPGADVVARVRAALDGERIELVPWSPEPRSFIAAALGLAEVAPMVLRPLIVHVQVLVGEIDLRGMNGWRGLNRLLASTLTGWRIHLEPIAASPAWAALSVACAERRPIAATVVDVGVRGTRVNVHGLLAHLPRRDRLPLGQELQVRVARLDADEGRIWVSRRLGRSAQLSLPI
jgi:hypothetical protein